MGYLITLHFVEIKKYDIFFFIKLVLNSKPLKPQRMCERREKEIKDVEKGINKIKLKNIEKYKKVINNYKSNSHQLIKSVSY